MSGKSTGIKSEEISNFGKSEKMVVEQENSLQTINEENIKMKELKERLKDVAKFSRYLDKCKVNKESFELLNYLDSSADSNIFSINIIYKNKKR